MARPPITANLMRMGRAFHEAAKPEWPWSEADFAATMSAVEKAGFLAVTESSFFAGIIQPHPLNREWLVAHELLWWSEDGSGWKHFRAFRKWAKAQGAKEIRWSCRHENDRVRRFYATFSRPVEAVYSEVF